MHSAPMTTADNVEIVQSIYADFQAGRVAAILARIDPAVDWHNAGPELIPYARTRRGVREVGQFFEALAACVDVQSFEPREYVAQGNRVIALGTWSGLARSTGHAFRSEWAMSWSFEGGRVTAFRSFEDTHEIAQAFTAA